MIYRRNEAHIQRLRSGFVRFLKMKVGGRIPVWLVVLAGLIGVMLISDLQDDGPSEVRWTRKNPQTRQADSFDDFERRFDDFDRFDELFDDEPVHVMP